MKKMGVILAALAGAAALFAGCGAPGAPQGLPLAPNWRLIQVYTQQGKAMYLNAAVTPVLFVAVQGKEAKASAKAARLAAKDLKGLRQPRPLILVDTDIPGGTPAQAAAQVRSWAKANKVSLSVLLQAGPGNLYAGRVPELVWIGQHGHRHEVTAITGKVLEEAEVGGLVWNQSSSAGGDPARVAKNSHATGVESGGRLWRRTR